MTSNEIFKIYKNQVGLILLKKGVETLKRETRSIIEFIHNAKSDLDITQMQNKFCGSLIRQLDKPYILNLHRKFSFFEVFESVQA